MAMPATASVAVDTSAATAAMVVNAPAVSQTQQSATVLSAADATAAPAAAKRDILKEPADKVTLFGQPIENDTTAKKQGALAENKKEEKEKVKDAVRQASNVVWAYNSKGDLRIKYMDSANRLIYQSPPQLYARMYDLMLESKTSVDTTA